MINFTKKLNPGLGIYVMNKKIPIEIQEVEISREVSKINMTLDILKFANKKINLRLLFEYYNKDPTIIGRMHKIHIHCLKVSILLDTISRLKTPDMQPISIFIPKLQNPHILEGEVSSLSNAVNDLNYMHGPQNRGNKRTRYIRSA